ncbi:hypothetical protein FC756_16960 [Lysinibacillus mangiferihumi]|uniref:PrgI family protein n=1 Tax=Lysinibacillus mangiferihumi TaxID=1130819 RepID=A0A4U2YUR7_9BACI|nr:DUF5592 family protein [Lysinibacillus mangiferihumi]TKI65278.1 hypothetical protein FC756_16960 [Lysinibacillus mangiferihumi]
MYEIPKEIKSKPQIVGLEIKELIILLVSFFLFFTVLRDLVHGILVIPYLLVAGSALFWMVMPSRNNPRLKNYMSLYLYFKQNKYTYHAIDSKKIINDYFYREEE